VAQIQAFWNLTNEVLVGPPMRTMVSALGPESSVAIRPLVANPDPALRILPHILEKSRQRIGERTRFSLVNTGWHGAHHTTVKNG
jgi:hypothetical protein